MDDKDIEIIDLTNQQYNELLRVQGDQYKKLLKFCIENIADSNKVRTIKNNILKIDRFTKNEIEEIKVNNEKFIEYLKESIK